MRRWSLNSQRLMSLRFRPGLAGSGRNNRGWDSVCLLFRRKGFAQRGSGKYSTFVLLVQALGSVAIALAAAAFAIDILDSLPYI